MYLYCNRKRVFPLNILTTWNITSINRYSIRRGEVTSRVEVVPIKDTMLSEMCPDVEASFCFPQKYRNPNGECNNVKHPMWGVTGAAYLRLQEPQYEDGVRTPRNMARSGRTKLPDALTVSSKLIWTRNNPHEHLTSLAAIWGQFVSHDISYTLPLSGYEKVMNYLNFLSPSC